MKAKPSGIILAGGKSSRFGGDKALAEIGGKTLLLRAFNILNSLCGEILIVGRSDIEISNSRVRAVPDIVQDIGPIGGLYTGLSSAKSEHCVVMAVDMPFVTTEFLERVLGSIGSAAAAVPESDGQMQPLCAVYNRSCLSILEGYIREGNRSVFGFLDRIDYCRVGANNSDQLDDIDTQEQWLAAKERFSKE